ncbi:HAD family hydrolase [Streptomyces lichenis]|uniref:HAD family phosphatase n=1 Tax=Streptomyces lichenis TaxID=2306967 RepID=A0ABT0I3V2_9ACTN|nr:HAD family phosphatase [Streptomyces lichenis]MCK8676006.1 HAD family phosphatase [Streptomyces lichenis]
MSRPSVVWFDFGGVLSPPLDDLFRSYEQRAGVTPDQLRTAFADVSDEVGLPPLAPVELARMTEREWGGRLRAALARRHPGIDLSRARLEEFGAQWFDGHGANPVMAAAWRTLREHGITTGVLSNNVLEWRTHWMRMMAPLGGIDLLVDSCEVGCRKPDPEIYRLAARRAGVDPGECLLIDDVEANIDAARAQGWQAVHSTDDERTLAELAEATGVTSLSAASAAAPR